MKKHVVGFAIFSSIVGSAVLVSAFFNTPKEINAVVVDTVSYTSVTKKSCWKMKEESSAAAEAPPVIKQAVLDLNTKQMDWEIDVPSKKSPVALHFFVKGSKGNRYLATEMAPSPSLNKNSYNDGALEFTSSYIWLDHLGSYENLYVVPEKISRPYYRVREIEPKFDETTATSVLLYTGKADYPTEKYFKK